MMRSFTFYALSYILLEDCLLPECGAMYCSISTRLQDVISQQTLIFVSTALRTSNIAVIIRITKWRVKCVWHMVRMGEMINAYKVLVEKPEGQSQFGIPGHRFEGNNKINLKEVCRRVWTGLIS